MPNASLDRLNAAINEISKPAWKTTVFAGYNAGAVRDLVVEAIQHHFSNPDKFALDEQLSLGSRGGLAQVFKSSEDTETRDLKRMTLVFHRVLGYHSHQETEALKLTMLKASRADTLSIAKLQVQQGLNYAIQEELWAKEISARFGGFLTHYYNQGKDKRLDQMDKTENGWCLGMSVHWLGCKATMQEFWEKHDGNEAAGKYRFVMAAQGVRTAGMGDVSDRASFRLTKFGLKQVAVKRENANPTPRAMAEAIVKSPAPFCRIGQYYVDGGGHAMAASLARGGVAFLDPNLGEFQFKGRDEFVRWFPLFTQKMDYRFESFYVEQYQSTIVKAPPADIAKAVTDRRKAMALDED